MSDANADLNFNKDRAEENPRILADAVERLSARVDELERKLPLRPEDIIMQVSPEIIAGQVARGFQMRKPASERIRNLVNKR